MRHLAALVALALALAPLAAPAAVVVPSGTSIQAAIDAADGDVLQLEAGTYDGDLDYLGKAIRIVGLGPATVLRGTGTGPAVSIEASAARLFNNLVIYNTNAGGDPHSIDITGASPTIVNNTVVRGDSNGIIIRGVSAPLVMNNIIASNGSAMASERRGRGICDFSAGGAAVIHYNVFNRNPVGALLTDGRDFGAIRGAQRRIGPPRLIGNLDGRPGFVGRIRRDPDDVALADFLLDGRGRATNAGNPDPAYDDLDGTRNDAGFTGGPLAPSWSLD